MKLVFGALLLVIVLWGCGSVSRTNTNADSAKVAAEVAALQRVRVKQNELHVEFYAAQRKARTCLRLSKLGASGGRPAWGTEVKDAPHSLTVQERQLVRRFNDPRDCVRQAKAAMRHSDAETLRLTEHVESFSPAALQAIGREQTP